MRKHIKNNVSWLVKLTGNCKSFYGSDYSINNGSSQNAYLIEEEKTSSSILCGNLIPPEFIDNLDLEMILNTIDFIML